MTKAPTPRKHLSADALYRNLHQTFQHVPDPRTANTSIRLPDALMSGLAMFALKDPSLLSFDQRRQHDEKNLQMIFHIQHVPADTTLRETLDPIDHEQLRPAFRNVFAALQRNNGLASLRFLDGYNDCERNALKRFLPKFREDHPHLRVIATLDALYANAPVIRDLRAAFIPWIIRVKPDGNAFHVHSRSVAEAESPAGGTLVARRTCSLEDRKRNVQYVEEPRLPLRAQLRPRLPAPDGGAGDVDDAGLSGGPNTAALLPALRGSLEEVHQQTCFVGTPARDLPSISGEFDASDLCGHAFD